MAQGGVREGTFVSSGSMDVGKPGIYALVDPETLGVPYVGEGKDWFHRAKRHLQRGHLVHENPEMRSWLEGLFARGLKPDIELLEELEPEDYPQIHDIEHRWIVFWSIYGATPLLNKRSRGWGVLSHAPETLERMSQAQRKRYETHPELLAPCGTEIAYRAHLRHDEEPCDACRIAAREYDRKQYGREPFKPARCGTASGYNAHLRRDEEACRECKDAERDRGRLRQGSKPFKPTECGTVSGYHRHFDLEEESCNACRAANTAYYRKLRARKRGSSS